LEEFWTSVDWPSYLPDFDSLNFSICSVLQANVQAIPHANQAILRPSIATERNQQVGEIHLQGRPLILPLLLLNRHQEKLVQIE
jgi:hypothetical protein